MLEPFARIGDSIPRVRGGNTVKNPGVVLRRGVRLG